MADEPLPPTSRKHRVIHWNPDAGSAPVRRRLSWWRILAWTVGGFFGLLFAAGLVIRGIKLVFGPEVFVARAPQVPGPELSLIHI